MAPVRQTDRMAGGWEAGSLIMKRFAFVLVGAGSLVFAGQALAQETDSATFTASATTQEAISVACSRNLNFGTLAVQTTGGSQTTVNVPATSGGTATSSGSSVYVVSAGQSALCTVSGENNAGTADGTASLASGAATFTGTTLSGVPLEDTGIGTGTLSADIELSQATAVGNGDLFIGGTLTIPANHAEYATYEATVTLTVTD